MPAPRRRGPLCAQWRGGGAARRLPTAVRARPIIPSAVPMAGPADGPVTAGARAPPARGPINGPRRRSAHSGPVRAAAGGPGGGGCHGPPGTKRPRSLRGPAWGPVAALVPGMLGSYCARRSGSGAHPGRFPLRADARLPMALLAVCMAGGPGCVGTVEGGKDAPAAPWVWQYISLPRGAPSDRRRVP